VTRAAAEKGRVVRPPPHVRELLAKMNVAQWREPHDTELASAMGIRPERLREIRLAALYPSSIDRPMGDSGDHSLADLVADEREPGPEERANEALLAAETDRTMSGPHAT
jgi:DNA-directed RNA polymerase sigma subunit (sigma70/sigma32)